jgi:3-deoxy-D-arabino-heptulosonate 7-phosphate (DAHP) synthase
MNHEVQIGSFKIGAGNRPFLIAGPCVIESEQLVLETAASIAKIANSLSVHYIFKSSFDKANRTSITSYRGPGLEKGLAVLKKVKEQLGLPVLTDVHTEEQATEAGKIVDVLQIPAFLCRQTDLLIAAAKTGKVVNVKKGQFLSPQEMGNAVKKVEEAGNRKIICGPFLSFEASATRWSLTRPIACSCRVAGEPSPAANVNSSSPWPARQPASEWMASSWKSIPIRTRLYQMDPIWCRSINYKRC